MLANNPHRWTVLTFHHPMFSAAEGRDNPGLREHWLPVIDRHTEDLVGIVSYVDVLRYARQVMGDN